MVTLDDCLEAEDICKGDKGFQQLLRDRYDITDLASVACDPWYYGGRYRDSKHLAAQFPSLCSVCTAVHACSPSQIITRSTSMSRICLYTTSLKPS